MNAPLLDVLRDPVLVLNRYYQPVRVIRAREAFVLLFSERADALDHDYRVLGWDLWSQPATPSCRGIDTVRGRIRVPLVLLLRSFSRMPRTPVRLSRQNILIRDGHACLYCGATDEELTLDHILPKSRGGVSSWENLATCCRPCNLAKGHKTPDEAGMKLRSEPVRPTWNTLMKRGEMREPPDLWRPFLAAAG